MAALVPWYSSAAARAVSGRKARRASRLRWRLEPARKLSGHSQASRMRPKTKLIVWSTGIGLTAGSSVLVAKSQNILGQKNPSKAAATWSKGMY